MHDQKLLDAVIELTRKVGAYQLSKFRNLPPGSGEEKLAREFVSEVDVTSEKMLHEGLSALLPTAGFFGEETGTSGSESLRWIVDPLDGTTNFLSGLDQFCISVALEQDGRIMLGVILRPASSECFSSLRGKGVFRNGKELSQSFQGALDQALIGTGFPFRSPDLIKPFFACAEDLLGQCRDMRRFGAAAIDLSYVAAGFLQGFWESDLQPYDVAAALLFLEEIGCVMTNQKGENYSPYRDRVLICGFPQVHQGLLEIVERHYIGELSWD